MVSPCTFAHAEGKKKNYGKGQCERFEEGVAFYEGPPIELWTIPQPIIIIIMIIPTPCYKYDPQSVLENSNVPTTDPQQLIEPSTTTDRTIIHQTGINL
jgi:hypothetical protein